MVRSLALLGLAVALVFAGAARADGDPASDFLLSAPTFIPPDDGIPPAYIDQLRATVREAETRGYTIRVAVVGRSYDMGSVTVLFRKPRQYARFLGTELTLAYKDRLLIVMPNGLAVSSAGRALPRDQAVVDRIPAPGTDGAALASTASDAVVKLAAAGGVTVPRQPLVGDAGKASGSSATGDRITIAVAAAVVVLTLVLGAYLRRRLANRP